MTSRAIPVLAAASLTQFTAGVGFWSFGLLAPELAAETGLNERDFGLSITFTFIGAFLSSPFTGAYVRLLERAILRPGMASDSLRRSV